MELGQLRVGGLDRLYGEHLSHVGHVLQGAEVRGAGQSDGQPMEEVGIVELVMHRHGDGEVRRRPLCEC